MSKIAVCGLVNMETTVPVESFPVEYRPVDYKFFGINTSPAGVGFNISLALKALGDDVSLCSLCGRDAPAEIIISALKAQGISANNVLFKNKATAQSVVLYDNTGKRYIVCDLTDNQEQTYDEDIFAQALEGVSVACICNINYAAGLIPVAKRAGVLVATDVHCLSDINDEYNSRFMQGADILFLSNENIIGREQEFILSLAEKYNSKVIVIGMGDKGALLYSSEDASVNHVPAVYTRPVVNTVGAGDSLYSAFVHFYAKSRDPLLSLRRAVYFASYKIGEKGAGSGFLTESELLRLMDNR